MEDVSKKDIGQMIVVGGFIVAAGIVIVAASLNLVIFSQEVSTRDTGSLERNALGLTQTVENGAQSGMLEVNNRSLRQTANVSVDRPRSPDDVEGNDGLYGNYTKRLEGAVENFSMRRGTLADVDITVNQTAWRITQTKESEFENGTGAPDWNLTEVGTKPDVGDIEDTYSLQTDIDTSTVTGGDEFKILAVQENDVAGPSGFEYKAGWSMTVEKQGSDTKVTTCKGVIERKNPASGNTVHCGPASSPAPVPSFSSPERKTFTYSGGPMEVINGTVDGGVESKLQGEWFENNDDYHFEFIGGDEAEGTYDIRFDSDASPTPEACGGVSPPCAADNFGDMDSIDEPVVSGAVRKATADIAYSEAGLEYTHTSEHVVAVPYETEEAE